MFLGRVVCIIMEGWGPGVIPPYIVYISVTLHFFSQWTIPFSASMKYDLNTYLCAQILVLHIFFFLEKFLI